MQLLKHKVKDIHHARRTADDHGALPPSPVETDADSGAAAATATASEHAEETKGLLAQGLAKSYASLAGGSKHAAAEPYVSIPWLALYSRQTREQRLFSPHRKAHHKRRDPLYTREVSK